MSKTITGQVKQLCGGTAMTAREWDEQINSVLSDLQAIDDEVGCYDGGSVNLNQDRILERRTGPRS